MNAAQSNAIFAGVLGVGAIAAAAGTAGVPGVPAAPAGLAAVALLLAAVGAWGRAESPPRWATALLFAFAAGVAAQVVFQPGVPRGHDLQSHGWALYATWQSVLDGDPWPRWTPYIGLGVPLLQFYGPLPWVTTWPALAAGASPFEALQVGFVLHQAVGMALTWSAARGLGASRAASMLAALALAFAPYRLLDQSYRIALAEGFAMGLTPWTLAHALRVAKGEDRVRALALGTGALILTHPVTGLLLVPLAIPLLARPLLTGRRWVPLLLAAGLALGATAAFWLPMTAEQHHTTLSRTAPIGKQLAPLAAFPEELVTRQAWTKYDLRRKHSEEEDKRKAVPLYLGCGLLALLGLAVFRPEGEGPDPRPWALAALLAIALSTRPTAGALDLIPLYGRIQFPWRFLAPGTACAALAGGLALDRWGAGRARSALLVLAAGVLLYDAVPYLGAAEAYDDYRDVVVRGPGNRLEPLDVPEGPLVRIENLRLPPASFGPRVGRTTGVFPEYTNPVLRRRYLTRRLKPELAAELGVSWSIQRRRPVPVDAGPRVRLDGRPLPGATLDLRGERIAVSLPPDLPGGRLVIASQWFPGWRAQVDGGSWLDADAERGLLAVPVGAGARRVQLRYSSLRPWDRALGLLVSFGVLGWGLVGALRRR